MAKKTSPETLKKIIKATKKPETFNFADAMTSPQPAPFIFPPITKKQKKPKASPTKPQKTPYIDNNNINNIIDNKLIDNNSALSIIEDNNEVIDIKAKLTLQEIRFLEIYLTSDYKKGKDRMTIEAAMIAAGYTNISQRERYRIAANIVKKYERQAPLAQNILQDIGFGQLRIAKGMKRLSEKAKSEMVQYRALEWGSKATSMIQDVPQTNTGIQIVFTCSREAPPDPTKGAITIGLAPEKG